MIVTVHRGTREIGGNCIEVASPSTRLILDVGLPLVNDQREPFDSLKALRSTREQLIAIGTIKPVPGLFTDDAPAPNAILLSSRTCSATFSPARICSAMANRSSCERPEKNASQLTSQLASATGKSVKEGGTA